MPPGGTDEGIQAAERLRGTHPEVGVVVLSQYATPSYALALLERGSAGRAYLLKERVEDLESARRSDPRRRRGRLGDRPQGRRGARCRERPQRDSPLNQLTPRERDVLREMAEGKNNAAIAEALFLTERSVEKVIHSIFLKLGLDVGDGGPPARQGRNPLPGGERQRHHDSGSEPETRVPWPDSDTIGEPATERLHPVP